MTRLFFISILSLLLSHEYCYSQKISVVPQDAINVVKFHSKIINDNYYLQIKLPKKYQTESQRKFTTIYVLDGNVYFGVISKLVEQYEEMGVMAPVIVIGIGYKDIKEMERKRSRDFLFPKALPEYGDELESGGGEKFLKSLQTEIVAFVDSNYRTKADNRILMGHSFGGFFCLFALLNNLNKQNEIFRSYIAASPSLNYNNQYLLSKLATITTDFKSPKYVYTSLGSLEDGEDGEQQEYISSMFTNFSNSFSSKDFKNTKFKAEIYLNFLHMETPLATFDKGLLFLYRDNPYLKYEMA
jgi:predicted alpha/beta superfamily hydrolase